MNLVIVSGIPCSGKTTISKMLSRHFDYEFLSKDMYSYQFTHFGYCAEQAALLDMFAHNEFAANKIVTVTKNGDVIPPCGRCLELISQLNDPEFIEIAVNECESKKFHEIYPYDWKKQRI